MYILQKILSNIIISPGIFIILMILILVYLFNKKKIVIARLILLSLIISTYILSINPTKDKIVESLENKYNPITSESLDKGDSYIILGGGAYRSIPKSLNKNNGEPTKSGLARVIEGVRLYKGNPKPIIITGGSPYGEKRSEASIYKELMIDLEVPSKNIFIEEKSKTTEENAEYTARMLIKLGYKNPILITSATHMDRSKYIFKMKGIDVIPAPTDYRGTYKESYNLDDFFPMSKNFVDIKVALWEYIGILFYKIKN